MVTFYSIGYVNVFLVDNGKLYTGNNMGTVDIFNIESKKIIQQIVLVPRNKLVAQKVISVNYLNGEILIVSIRKRFI